MFTKLKRKIRNWLQVERGGEALLEDALAKGLQLGQHVNLISVPNFGSEPYLIKIGDYTTISFDCAFINHDAAAAVVSRIKDENISLFGPIVIGRNCFVGCRTIILRNVHIGDNTIIGACSVVNKDIPSNVIAAGVPCKVICTIDEFIEKHKKEFVKMEEMSQAEKRDFLCKYFDVKK